MSETVEELGPDTGGRWLVTTQGSKHIWDLDKMQYTRMPGEDRGSFGYDGATVRITRVDRYPRVGETSFVWYDDLHQPNSLEQWRKSSLIKKIERLVP